jgi:hypothetical protein
LTYPDNTGRSVALCGRRAEIKIHLDRIVGARTVYSLAASERGIVLHQ